MSKKTEVMKNDVTAPQNAVAAAQTTAIDAANDQVPEHIRRRQGQDSGLVADAKDFVIPRVKLLHGTSKEPETFNNAKPGEFWANVLDIPLGKEFEFVPLVNRIRVLLMRPMDDKTGEAILARSEDGKTWDQLGEWDVKLKGHSKADVKWRITDLDVEKSGLMDFGSSDPNDKDSNPAATIFYDFLIFIPALPQLGVTLLSFARTAAKKGRMLISKIEARGGPMYTQKYKIVVKKEVNDASQEFWNVEVLSEGWPDEATTDRTEKLAVKFQNLNYKVKDEAEGGGTETAAAGPVNRGEV